MVVGLTIAGSDPIGGAGIQADIKAMSALGVHPATVITCITSQNTTDVLGILPIPRRQIASQLHAVLEDAQVGAVKTGMLYSAEIARNVASQLKRTDMPLVVDPVLAAGVGTSLHSKGLVDAIIKNIVPLATCITPNRSEAEALTGIRIKGRKEAEKACEKLLALGAQSVLLKGGHFSGEKVVDVLLDKNGFIEIKASRVEARLHGSGCHLSAYLTGYLALGIELEEAVVSAKERVAEAITGHYAVGRGAEVLDSLSYLKMEAQRYRTLQSLKEATERLEAFLSSKWIPEEGIQFAYALANARFYEDVCGLEGPIFSPGERIRHDGCFAFGASRQLAKRILEAMRVDESHRSGLNLRFSDASLKRVEEAGLAVLVGEEEGQEPILFIFGTDPEDIVTKLRKVMP